MTQPDQTNIETDREREVVALLKQHGEVRCLGQTQGLSPRHPLYLAANTKREPLRHTSLPQDRKEAA